MDYIYVFGSNLAGIHGKGSALIARRKYGAILGVGQGLQGRSYAIPTKNRYIQALPLPEIHKNVKAFIAFARRHPELQFKVENVGCMNAGYSPKDIAPMFKEAPRNCFFKSEIKDELMRQGTRVAHWDDINPKPHAQGSLF